MSTPRIDLRPGVTEPVVLMLSRRQIESGDVAVLPAVQIRLYSAVRRRFLS